MLMYFEKEDIMIQTELIESVYTETVVDKEYDEKLMNALEQGHFYPQEHEDPKKVTVIEMKSGRKHQIKASVRDLYFFIYPNNMERRPN